MKIRLKYFLLACLLIGAVGVPWGWKVWQERRARLTSEKAQEIRRLEEELAELRSSSSPLSAIYSGDTVWVSDDFIGRQMERKTWERINVVQKRIEKLTQQPVSRRLKIEQEPPPGNWPAVKNPFGVPKDGVNE